MLAVADFYDLECLRFMKGTVVYEVTIAAAIPIFES